MKIETYEDAINDFLLKLKQIPIDQRDLKLKEILIEINNSDLIVAEKILMYFQTGQLDTENLEQQLDLTLINSVALTDYTGLRQISENIKSNAQTRFYIEKQEYKNHCLLEKFAKQQNDLATLASLEQQEATLATTNNLFKQKADIKQWLSYLETQNFFEPNKNNSMIAV